MARILRSIVCMVFLLLGGAAPAPAQAGPAQTEQLWHSGSAAAGDLQIQLYFFMSVTCPHCARADAFLERLDDDRPWLKVHRLPVDGSETNQAMLMGFLLALREEVVAVPAIFFCGQGSVGFDTAQTTGALIRMALDDCYATLRGGQGRPATEMETDRVDLPLIGTFDPKTVSLPVLTLVLGAADAFNPCAFFVLLFLLGMLVHVRSRRRMLLVGMVFVSISGLLYFAFMAAWLNLFLLLEGMRYVTLAAGAVAVAIALLNLKDFLWFKQGVSLSMSAGAKQRLFGRMRGLLSADRLPALLVGTVTLAIAANTYELLCTSGLPLVYTHILTLSGLSSGAHYLYLAAYNLVYVLPLLAITLAFTLTMGRRTLSERGGRLLKLLSGLMMLGLGLVLLVDPALLDNPLTALGLIGLAIVLTGAAAVITRRTDAGKSV